MKFAFLPLMALTMLTACSSSSESYNRIEPACDGEHHKIFFHPEQGFDKGSQMMESWLETHASKHTTIHNMDPGDSYDMTVTYSCPKIGRAHV